MKKKTLKKLSSVKSKHRPKHFFKRFKKTPSAHKIKDKKLLKFPRILRTFTEKYFLACLILFVLVVMLVVVGMDLYKDIDQKQKIDKERQEIVKQLQFWQSVVAKYKDYRDAYFQLAILDYRLGDISTSKFYLKKALDIDPNFEKGRELEKILLSTK